MSKVSCVVLIGSGGPASSHDRLKLNFVLGSSVWCVGWPVWMRQALLLRLDYSFTDLEIMTTLLNGQKNNKVLNSGIKT